MNVLDVNHVVNGMLALSYSTQYEWAQQQLAPLESALREAHENIMAVCVMKSCETIVAEGKKDVSVIPIRIGEKVYRLGLVTHADRVLTDPTPKIRDQMEPPATILMQERDIEICIHAEPDEWTEDVLTRAVRDAIQCMCPFINAGNVAIEWAFPDEVSTYEETYREVYKRKAHSADRDIGHGVIADKDRAEREEEQRKGP